MFSNPLKKAHLPKISMKCNSSTERKSFRTYRKATHCSPLTHIPLPPKSGRLFGLLLTILQSLSPPESKIRSPRVAFLENAVGGEILRFWVIAPLLSSAFHFQLCKRPPADPLKTHWYRRLFVRKLL